MTNPNFKNSEIEWIGEIPKDWSLTRIKSFSKIKARIGWQALKSEEFTEVLNDPYCITGTDIINSKVIYDKAYHVSKERYLIDKNIIIKENDVLVTKDGTIGKVAVVEDIPKIGATLNSGLFRVRLDLKKFNPIFLKYIVRSFVFTKYIDLKTTGSTINHLYQYLFEPFVVPNPSINQQIMIADYLDYHTTKIDKKISLLEQKVEKLDEYKQALVYETVTKGLNHTTLMKDSDIEWIGMIPEHWKITKIKNLANVATGQTPPRELNECFSEEKENNYLWIKPEDLLGNIETYKTKEYITLKGLSYIKKYNKNSIIISGIGDIGKIGLSSIDFTTNQQNHIIYNHKENYKYMFYFLVCAKKDLEDKSTGNVVSILNANKLKNYVIIVPPITEQNEIVDFLEKECLKLDNKKELINKKIELLKEYKQSLIYEVVTGKIEIKD